MRKLALIAFLSLLGGFSQAPGQQEQVDNIMLLEDIVIPGGQDYVVVGSIEFRVQRSGQVVAVASHVSTHFISTCHVLMEAMQYIDAYCDDEASRELMLFFLNKDLESREGATKGSKKY